MTPINSNAQQINTSKNTISISPLGAGTHPQLELQMPQDGSQPVLQLPQFNTQFTPGSGATFVPLQNTIHPASGAFDHMTLEDQKPDLGQFGHQQQSQNAIAYPSDDGMGSLQGGNQAQQGGAQVNLYYRSVVPKLFLLLVRINMI